MRDIARKCLDAKSDIPNHEYTEIDKELGGKGFHELFGVNQWLELGKMCIRDRPNALMEPQR